MGIRINYSQNCQPSRFFGYSDFGTKLDLFEHQGKELFASYKLPVSEGGVAFTPEEAEKIAERLGCPVVVKAQVHTGGRGKAGGVKLADSPEMTKSLAKDILGLDINGHIVKRLWIEKASDIDAEYYVSFTLDRSKRLHLAMLSAEGGVDIEEVAEKNPEAIVKIWIDPTKGFDKTACENWVQAAGLESAAPNLVDLLMGLYEAFVSADADLVEVNPLIRTPEGVAHILDSKISLDANSIFRHQDYQEYEETQPRDERELAAKEKGLQYVGLEGSVGVIANGAGLAMSTVDVVHQVGGKPANFLDIGGGADADVMTGALEVINNDPEVKSIFINIFGGITRGEEVAGGILAALERIDISSPIVVRLDGTNAEEGQGNAGAAPFRFPDNGNHNGGGSPPRGVAGWELNEAKRLRKI